MRRTFRGGDEARGVPGREDGCLVRRNYDGVKSRVVRYCGRRYRIDRYVGLETAGSVREAFGCGVDADERDDGVECVLGRDATEQGVADRDEDAECHREELAGEKAFFQIRQCEPPLLGELIAGAAGIVAGMLV